MEQEIVSNSSRSALAPGCGVPASLIAKLSVTTGAPSSGMLSDAETVILSDADILAALEEIRARFRGVAKLTRKNLDNRSVRRTMAQLALNKRILEEEREKRDTLRATG